MSSAARAASGKKKKGDKATLGIVTLATWNLNHFGKTDKPALSDKSQRKMESPFDDDIGFDSALDATTHPDLVALNDRMHAEARKSMKAGRVADILANAKSPIDALVLQEVNNQDAFAAALLEWAAKKGLKLAFRDDPNDGTPPDLTADYTLFWGPEMRTGSDKHFQTEYYPILVRTSQFNVVNAIYIPTHDGDQGDIGVPQDVESKTPIHTGKGKSRPLVGYTLQRKGFPSSPLLQVIDVHTKPSGSKIKSDQDAKNRKKVFAQLEQALIHAAGNNDSRWVFIGDHYLAPYDTVGRGVTVDDALPHGMVSLDPPDHTNTEQRLDTAPRTIQQQLSDLGQYGKSKDRAWRVGRLIQDLDKLFPAGRPLSLGAAFGALEQEKSDLDADEETKGGDARISELVAQIVAQAPQSKPTLRPRADDEDEDETDLGPSAPFLDKSEMRLADKMFVSSEFVVRQSGLLGIHYDDPTDMTADPSVLLLERDATEVKSDTKETHYVGQHQHSAHFAVVSDHLPVWAVVSDDPDDAHQASQMVHRVVHESDWGDRYVDEDGNSHRYVDYDDESDDPDDSDYEDSKSNDGDEEAEDDDDGGNEDDDGGDEDDDGGNEDDDGGNEDDDGGNEDEDGGNEDEDGGNEDEEDYDQQGDHDEDQGDNDEPPDDGGQQDIEVEDGTS